MALIPNADLVLRKVPEGMNPEVALFAGDVMGTGFHAIQESGMRPGDVVAVLGLGPVGLCASRSRAPPVRPTCSRSAPSPATGGRRVLRRPAPARHRAGCERGRQHGDRRPRCGRERGRGGDPRVLESAIRITRACGAIQCVGVSPSARRCTWACWLKALTIRGGQANVLGHVDRVLAMLSAGVLDPRRW